MTDEIAGVEPASPAPKGAAAAGGLFSILSRLFAGDRDKKRALKRIAKYVKKSRPRLYEPRIGTVEPQLAELAHDFHGAFFAAQNLLQRENLYEILKVVVINGNLSNRQLDTMARIEDGALRERVAGQSFGTENTVRIDCSADWDGALETLRVYAGFSVVGREKWIKALRKIKRLQESDILSLIVKLIEDDREFTVGTNSPRERVVAPYLSKYKLQAALSLEKIQRELKNKRTEKLLREVFEDQEIPELSHYTETESAQLSKRNLPDYRYVNELRYTKTFLTDFYKSRIRELIRMLVVKGEWKDTVMSRHLSDKNQQLIEKLGAVRQLDAGLAEDKPTGAKLRNAVYQTIRNKANRPGAKNLIDQINKKVGEIIRDIIGDLKTLNGIFEKIYTGFVEGKEDVLHNWEALMRQSGENLPGDISQIVAKIDAFVKLVEIRETD